MSLPRQPQSTCARHCRRATTQEATEQAERTGHHVVPKPCAGANNMCCSGASGCARSPEPGAEAEHIRVRLPLFQLPPARRQQAPKTRRVWPRGPHTERAIRAPAAQTPSHAAAAVACFGARHLPVCARRPRAHASCLRPARASATRMPQAATPRAGNSDARAASDRFEPARPVRRRPLARAARARGEEDDQGPHRAPYGRGERGGGA